MKKFYRLIGLVGIILMIVILPTTVYGQNKRLKDDMKVSSNNSIFTQNPVRVLDSFYSQANKNSSDRVQNTDLDTVTSNHCDELSVDGRFSISRTLCNIKMKLGDYLQYVMYVGLAVATILLIWNGFQLVTASDKSKQMGTFKKNLIYIIIGVILLVSFYYIIDVFVSLVNLVAE